MTWTMCGPWWPPSSLALTLGVIWRRQRCRASAAQLTTFLPRYTPFTPSGSGPQLMQLHACDGSNSSSSSRHDHVRG
jgi:hypothetical protein